MIKNMVYETIKFGNSADINIRGDAEKITVELRRTGHLFSTATINKHPRFFEKIFPAYADPRLTAFTSTEEEAEKLFQYRIKRCIRINTEFAKSFVIEDEEQEKIILAKRKIDEEARMDIDKFIESVLPKDGQREPKPK